MSVVIYGVLRHEIDLCAVATRSFKFTAGYKPIWSWRRRFDFGRASGNRETELCRAIEPAAELRSRE